jgi:hypothetical protein
MDKIANSMVQTRDESPLSLVETREPLQLGVEAEPPVESKIKSGTTPRRKEKKKPTYPAFYC